VCVSTLQCYMQWNVQNKIGRFQTKLHTRQLSKFKRFKSTYLRVR
jgi:hypothetical protein